MKKNQWLLSLMLGMALCGCTNNEEISVPAGNGLLATEAEFVRLSDNNEQIAGELAITSNAETVNVKWNTEEFCNLDTTQTVIRMKNGRGVLPIKWQKELPEGTYGPDEISYKAGVLLTAGETSLYVPLIWADRVDSAKIATPTPLTRSAGEMMPRVAQIKMTPTTVNMNYETGGAMFIELLGVPYAIFDLSQFIADTHIDATSIPGIITSSDVVNFQWTSEGPPTYGFSVQLVASGEGITQIGNVTYQPEGPTTAVYSGSDLPAANIPQEGDTYTFTFTGSYFGGLQARALVDTVVIATGTEVSDRQPKVKIPENPTTSTRNITFQYKRADGDWTNMPNTTNRTQTARVGITLAGYIWAPANLRKVGNIYTFYDSQEEFSGAWNENDYWGWNMLNPLDNSTKAQSWKDENDPCRKVAPAGTWRTPTATELRALANTVNAWGKKKYIVGRYFGDNNELFLPATGWRDGYTTRMSNIGYAALYWASTSNGTDNAFALGIQSDNVRVDSYIVRNVGLPIRCISAK